MDKITTLKLKRFQYLHHLYDLTDGDEMRAADGRELGAELGFSDEETDRITDYLKGEHLIRFIEMGSYGICITHRGIAQVEMALSQPDQPTKYFPPAKIGSHEQQPSPGPSTPSRMPSAFISYSWDSDEHKLWVREFAERLRQDGVDLKLDQWELAPGDMLSAFMERAVRENDFVLIVCTPRYRQRSDARTGGVGYEGDIMTGEVLTDRNHRKFIPILRQRDWNDAAPSWLKGKVYIDLRGEPYSEKSYQDLLSTLLGQRQKAPPIGAPRIEGHSGNASPEHDLPEHEAEGLHGPNAPARKKWVVTFTNQDFQRVFLTDALQARFKFSIIDARLIGTPRERESKHSMTVTMSDILMDCWRLAGALDPSTVTDDMVKVVFQIAEDHITELLRDGTLPGKAITELQMMTENSPAVCPYKLANIAYPAKPSFEVEIQVIAEGQ